MLTGVQRCWLLFLALRTRLVSGLSPNQVWQEPLFYQPTLVRGRGGGINSKNKKIHKISKYTKNENKRKWRYQPRRGAIESPGEPREYFSKSRVEGTDLNWGGASGLHADAVV